MVLNISNDSKGTNIIMLTRVIWHDNFTVTGSITARNKVTRTVEQQDDFAAIFESLQTKYADRN